MNTEKNSAAVKDARRLLAAKVRDDWEFPLPGARRSSTSTPTSSLQPDSVAPSTASTLVQPALEWRERSYASSDPSTTSEADDAAHSTSRLSLRRLYTKAKPDAEPEDPSRKKHERKLRRRHRLDEEMGWNTGLAHWVAQRDAWCCARLVRRSSVESGPPGIDVAGSAEDMALDVREDDHDASSKECASEVQDPSLTTQSMAAVTLEGAPDNAYTALIPVASPILSDTDPTRASITPALYPSIYSKIVTQSLTPSVPINLSHMIRALVQGWKDDGEWPPKPAFDNSASVGRGFASRWTSNTTKSCRLIERHAQTRQRRLGGSSAKSNLDSTRNAVQESMGTGAADPLENQSERESSSGHWGVRKGVGRVGRALRASLSGSTTNETEKGEQSTL